MVGRILVLVAALVVAAIGAGLVLLYARNAVDVAERNAAGTFVLVATDVIAAGTPLGEAQFRLESRKVTDGLRLAGALTAPLTPEQLDLTVSRALAPNQQLTETDLGIGNDASIGDNNLVQFVIDDAARVSGFAEQGSRVAVYVTADPDGQGERLLCTQMLAQSVEIAAIGPVVASDIDPATGLPPASTNTNVTFLLDPGSDLGQRLIQAVGADGLLSLVVVGGDSPPPTAPPDGPPCLSLTDVLDRDADTSSEAPTP